MAEMNMNPREKARLEEEKKNRKTRNKFILVGIIVVLMIALVIFVVLDYVTGIMCAIADKKLSSSVGFKGICRKVLIFLLVGVAHIVDLHVVGSGSALRGAVVCFYLSNEGVSMLENAAHLGLPIPEKLKAILEQLHDREMPVAPDDTTDNTNDGQ